MRWILAGCWGLVLISLSVAQEKTLQISQKPRFYGGTTRSDVTLYCQSSKQDGHSTVEWYKIDNYSPMISQEKMTQIWAGGNIKFQSNSGLQNAYLIIKEVQIDQSGVYHCKINTTWGPGTEIRISRPILLEKASYRSNVKDGLIVFQGFLLAVMIAALLLRKQKLLEQRDSIYEEPETDHIYEGLAIETCGGGLYEELSVYAQAEGAEAPWE